VTGRIISFLSALALSGCVDVHAQAPPNSPQSSAPAHYIKASPNPVPSGAGPGTTTITWKTGDGSDGFVYVSTDGGAEVLFARSPSGSAVADWIGRASVYEFRLYGASSPRTLLARATVRAERDGQATAEPPGVPARVPPVLTATPNPVPSGFGLGSTKISWDTGDGSPGRIAVSVDRSPETLFASGSRGSSRAEWIDSTGASYRFVLYREGTVGEPLASVTVTRRPRSLAIASAIAGVSLICLVALFALLAWRILRLRKHPDLRRQKVRPTVAQASLIALGVHFLAFRTLFAYELAAGWNDNTLSMLAWNDQFWVARILRYGAKDLATALVVFMAAWSIHRVWPTSHGKVIRHLGEVILIVALTAIGIAGVVHLRMVMELGAGLDLPALHEMLPALGGDLDDFVRWRDLVLAGSPVLIYVFLRSPWGSIGRWSGAPAITVVVALVGVAAVRESDDSELLVDHPLIAIARQLVSRPDLGTSGLAPLRIDSRLRPGFIDPALASPTQAHGAGGLCRPERRPGSLLLIGVEALAMRQLASPDGEIGAAMPYFAGLAEGGWWLREHRASANATPQAAFSMFTGLSPFPEVALSVTSSRFRMPAIWSRLPFDDRFLLTPASLAGFFPLGLVRHDGLKEILATDELKSSASRRAPAGWLNELDGVDALVRRLRATAGRPFFGTYWSSGTHPPYFDADPPRRMIAAPASDRERYLNTARNFDNQLQRIIQALRQANHADDTLLVVVGDHGQAFGEHGVWQHGRSSWEEVLHVPALIWQPAALSPRVESRLTTHADLLPTILDMLGVAFDPLDFQGESLCAPELRRRYAFATGREGVVISWDVATRSKLSWSHLTGQCRRFELASDPNERDELPCETTSEQYQTMKRFYLSQRKTLLDYAGSRRLAD